jgi:mRNA-degrading endonuclease RelE of RelBE toxin-antitoxin system
MEYSIHWTRNAREHLRGVSARDQRKTVAGIELHLKHQPQVETLNRKKMRPNEVAPWELRIGNLRVYYDVMEEPEHDVMILAIGIKDRNCVYIGGEAVDL